MSIPNVITVQDVAAAHIRCYDFLDGRMCEATYRPIERTPMGWVCELMCVETIMPPLSPQADLLRNPNARLSYLGLVNGFRMEASARRREWNELGGYPPIEP